VRSHSIGFVEGCTFPRNARRRAPTRPPFLRNFRAAGILGSHGATTQLRRARQQESAYIRSARGAHPTEAGPDERPTRPARCRRRADAIRAARSSSDQTTHVRGWRVRRRRSGHGSDRRSGPLGAAGGRQRQARSDTDAWVRNESSGASGKARSTGTSQAGVVADAFGGLLARTRTVAHIARRDLQPHGPRTGGDHIASEGLQASAGMA